MSACAAGTQGANVALRLLKERADSAEARAAAALKQISNLKASLQVLLLPISYLNFYCISMCTVAATA